MSPTELEIAMRAAQAFLDGLLKPAAYLDPGSGSYLLQLFIAGALGALFAIRHYWSRIKDFFSGLFGRSEDDGEDTE